MIISLTKFEEKHRDILRKIYVDEKIRMQKENALLGEEIPDFDTDTEGELILIAELNEVPVGFISVWEKENFIHHLYISKPHQMMGIGKLLLAAITNGENKTFGLKCLTANKAALNFYTSLGWKKTSLGHSGEGDYVFLQFTAVNRTEYLIRPEEPRDIPVIFKVNQEAFGQDDEARLVDRLRQSQSFIPELSLVATKGETVVGHILFTRVRIINRNKETTLSLALAPMAVLPAYQGKGIGSLLVNTGLKHAKEMGFGSVIVLGHEHYYPRFGFVPAINYGIEAPFPVQMVNFMAIELFESSLRGVTGMIKYDAAFGL